jgi:hypothetical protein
VLQFSPGPDEIKTKLLSGFDSACQAALLHAASAAYSLILSTRFDVITARFQLLVISAAPALNAEHAPVTLTKVLQRCSASDSRYDGGVETHMRQRSRAGN